MKKIHICYFIGSLKFGGAQKHIVDLINNLDDEIFEVFLVLANDSGYFLNKLNLDDDHILFLNLRRYYDLSGFIGIARIVRFVWRKKIEIFQSYLFECNVYGAICRLFKPQMKYVISIRNMNYTYTRQKIISLRIASWLSNYVTVVCKKVGGFIIEREKIKLSKIRVLYNSVDHFAYSRSINWTDRNNSNSAIHIVCVASLNYRKGHDYLLKAFSRVKKKADSVKLHLIGDGKRKNELELLAIELGIDQDVFFKGYVKDVVGYLRNMNIFVLSSLEEGMSNALLEAMAMGIPAVTTDVGGNSEVNIDGNTGFIVPSMDSIALEDALLKLIKDRTLRIKMGNNAQKRIVEHFSIDKMINNYMKFYCEEIMA